MTELQVFSQDSQPSTSSQTIERQRSSQNEVDKRMKEFVTYFVKEFEAKLLAYNLILEGEVKKAGKISDTFSGIIGQTVGGTVGGLLGLFLGSAASGAKLGSATGEVIGKKIGTTIGTDQQSKKVTALSDLVDLFLEDKVKSRIMLIETGIDVFQSFELQFMRVIADHRPKKAMQLLAKDATHRAIGYCAQNKEASLTDGILLGESKIEPVMGVPIISDKIKTPGFPLEYEYENGRSSWYTSSLYQKVGLLIESVVPEDSVKYYEKKDRSSKTSKYGYRRLFVTENWNSIKNTYRESNISKCAQFTNYQYSLSLTSKNIIQRREIMMEIVKQSDNTLTVDRMEEILAESLENIIKDISVLKRDVYRPNEQYDELVLIETTLKSSSTLQYLDKLSRQLSGVKEEIVLSIEQGLQENREHFVRLSHKLDEIVSIQQVARNEKKVWFNMKEPVENFTGRENKLKELHEALQCENELVAVSQIASICGLGGVGKTELARRFAYDKDRNGDAHWNNAIWINAETYSTLSDSFKKMAVKLKIPIKECQDVQDIHDIYFTRNNRLESEIESFAREIRYIVEDIYEMFKHSKILIIFDNAKGYQDIQEFLPYSFSPDNKKPYLLITSRNTDWDVGKEGKIRVIKLEEFTSREAVSFVKAALSIKNYAEDELARQLAESLQKFPLALDQATAYIKEKSKIFRNRGQLKYGIEDYLKEFSEEKKRYDLLSFEPKDSRYTETLFTAWMITFSNIKGTSNTENLALEMLSVISYLAPDKIDVKQLFFPKVVPDEEQMWNAFELLDKYSMIKLEKGVCSIHRLLQQVIRLQKRKMRLEEGILEGALTLFANSEGVHFSHIVTIWEHASEYDALVRNFIHSTYNERNILYLLSETGNFKLIERLSKILDSVTLKEKANASKRDGFNPLLTAAINGKLETVKYFIANLNCDINVKTKRGCFSALHLAACKGHLDIVKYLLDDVKVEVNVKARHDETELYCSASNEHLNVLGIETTTFEGWTPLHLASYYSHLHVMKYLVEQKNANLNAKANDNWTPLHFSIIEGNLTCMKYLIDAGADCNAKSKTDGYTLLHMAAYQDHVSILIYLIEIENFSLKQKLNNGQTPLHCAAENGHLNTVKYIVEDHEPDFREKDNNGRTPLHLAALNGHQHVVKFFMEDKKMEWNLKDKHGNNVLHLASYRGNLDTVKYLVENRHADFSVKSDQGLTPLQCAVVEKQFATAKYFIKEKGDFVLSRKDNETLLHYAARGNEEKIIRLVLEEIREQDAQNLLVHINAKDDVGNTPLMCAASDGKAEAMHILFKHGADINSKNTEGETAMSLAAKGKHWKIVAFLENNGVEPSMLNTHLKQDYSVYIKSQCGAHDLFSSSESEYYSLSSSSDKE